MADKAPTPAEVAKAREVLNRDNTIRVNKEREALAPVMDFVGSKEFTKLNEMLEALPPELYTNASVTAHLTAIKVGLMGLAGVNSNSLPIMPVTDIDNG